MTGPPGSEVQPAATGRGWLKALLGLAGGALFAGLVWAAGPAEIYQQLLGFGWALPLLLLPYLVVYLLDARGWQLAFLNRPPGFGFWRLFLVRTAGEAINYSLPSAYVGGEPVKALILKKRGVSGVEAAASVIVAKTTMTVAQILFVLLGIAAFFWSAEGVGEVPGVLEGALVGLGLGLVIVILIVTWQRTGFSRPLVRLTERLGLGRPFVERHRAALERLDQALIHFHRTARGRFWRSTGLFLLGWLTGVFEVWLFARLLGLELSLPAALAIEALATVAKAAAFFIPASLGAQEGGQVLLFLAYGFSEVIGVTFSLVRRFRELVWIGLGFLLLWRFTRPDDDTSPRSEGAGYGGGPPGH